MQIYQTFWQRVVALLIDSVILYPLIWLSSFSFSGIQLIVVPVIVLQLAYYTIAHALYGQTVGKKIMNVKVVRSHEHLPLTWKHAIMRESIFIFYSFISSINLVSGLNQVLGWISITVVLADIAVAILHPRHRAIHDFIGATVVIKLS